MVQPTAIPTAELLPEDESAVESTKFWRHERDLAALLVYIKKTGPPSIQYLLPPAQFDSSMKTVWNEGTDRSLELTDSLPHAFPIR